MPVHQKRRFFERETSHGRNPARHDSYFQDWGTYVVSEFLSTNVGSGTESSRNIKSEHKAPILIGKGCYVIIGASFGLRQDEDRQR